MRVKLLEHSDTAAEIAREAFAAGDLVTGIAAVQLAAQLIQLARLTAYETEAEASAVEEAADLL